MRGRTATLTHDAEASMHMNGIMVYCINPQTLESARPLFSISDAGSGAARRALGSRYEYERERIAYQGEDRTRKHMTSRLAIKVVDRLVSI